MTEPSLPQRPTDERVDVDSVEWFFEPDWPGRRLLAHVRDGGVRLTDVAGAAVDDEPGVASLLARSLLAGAATIDGVWTDQPFVDEEGEPGERRAFVAIDLLALDGEELLDVPFQERRRLLESVLDESLHVRVSPAVKQPVAGWLAGWRRAGFTHYQVRHQNARYHPGGQADDWLRVPLEGPPTPGLVRRVIGGRLRAPRRIRD
jgi:bifunctional non-homologous end joining protein LigD